MEASGSESSAAKILAESMRRFCRSIELCDGYLRGYYGLTLVSPLPHRLHITMLMTQPRLQTDYHKSYKETQISYPLLQWLQTRMRCPCRQERLWMLCAKKRSRDSQISSDRQRLDSIMKMRLMLQSNYLIRQHSLLFADQSSDSGLGLILQYSQLDFSGNHC